MKSPKYLMKIKIKIKNGNNFLWKKKPTIILLASQVYAFPVIICTTEKFSKSLKIASFHGKKNQINCPSLKKKSHFSNVTILPPSCQKC